MDSRAIEVIDQHGKLKSDRAVWENHWREVAERILPRQDDFQQTRLTEGEKRSQKIFDSTGLLALDRAASAIDSLITPSTQRYHGLGPEDDALEDDHEIKIYLDKVTKFLFRMRYRPLANFASQAHECYVSLMAFGTLGMFADDVLGIGMRYKSCALAELYIAESHAGIIDLVHREFPLTARAAAQKWGMDKLPDKIKKATENNPFQKFDFLHCVKPNGEMDGRKKDYRGMEFSSYYVAIEGKQMLSVGGYRTMPYMVSRHVTAPRETYGRSPAMMVLADIKMVNEIEKTIMRTAHKILEPPLLLHGDGVLNAFNTRPGALNFGGVDQNGNQLVIPMKTGANLPVTLEMAEQKRKLINDAFYVTLFQILVQNPQMTATEALIRAQEKGQLLAPTVGRQESEFLGALIMRELDVYSAYGVLPPMPDKLRDAGGRLKVIYTSPLSRLRRAEDGIAILRTLEGITPLANVKPSVMDTFDEDEMARELGEINGIPARTMRTREMVAEMRAAKQQQEQMAADLQQAEVASNAAKNMGQAAQAAGFVQPAIPQ